MFFLSFILFLDEGFQQNQFRALGIVRRSSMDNRSQTTNYSLSWEFLGFFFANIIDLPGRKNQRKSVLEITKMFYFLFEL